MTPPPFLMPGLPHRKQALLLHQRLPMEPGLAPLCLPPLVLLQSPPFPLRSRTR